MKRAIFVGKWYIIEPLGVMLLAGLAKEMGVEVSVVLVKDFDFEPLMQEVKTFKPDVVCFSIWTGYHVQTFKACDAVLSMGVQVAIGGPHATYFTDECARHSTWTIKGEGFRPLRKMLSGELPPGIHHDKELMAEGFPIPDRGVVYDRYPVLANSPIKSIMASVGCPFHCSYCYAPTWNEMHGGFSLHCRSIDHIVKEARQIKDKWPVSMIYFQDDVFGFDMKWLKEFCRRWPQEVGIPWHCQIRLELTQKQVGLDRLRMFREGGCTGITLAIESGNEFLREFVLLRGMSHDLIMEGTGRILAEGLTLRTEQILAVPFSDTESDLQTLDMNCQINPQMAWTSILAPYGGTKMGQIASQMGFYKGNNDDLTETFFDRSVLNHYEKAIECVEPHVRARQANPKDNPLLRMVAHDRGSYVDVQEGTQHVTRMWRLQERGNEEYNDRTVILQRLFNWFSKIPNGHILARDFLARPKNEWTRATLNELAHLHLEAMGHGRRIHSWLEEFHHQAGDHEMPMYYIFMPGGAELAKTMAAQTVTSEMDYFNVLGRLSRHHLFETWLYKLRPVAPPIAEV